jgi:drug/metabolite transporter (DMT)-like permease
LATAIAIAALLVRRDYGQDEYRRRIKNANKLSTQTEQLALKVAALEERLDINSSGQTAQTWWAAGASVVGALFWGFGDVLARGWLQRWPHH